MQTHRAGHWPEHSEDLRFSPLFHTAATDHADLTRDPGAEGPQRRTLTLRRALAGRGQQRRLLLACRGHMWAKVGALAVTLSRPSAPTLRGSGQKLQGALDLRQSKKAIEILFDRPSKRLTCEWDPSGPHTAHFSLRS